MNSNFNVLLLISFLSIVPSVFSGIVTEGIKNLVSSNVTFEAILELPSVMESVKSSPEYLQRSGEERIQTFIRLLQTQTSTSQKPLLSIIQNHVDQEDITQFWISNKIHIKNATPNLVLALTQHPGPHILREVITAHVVDEIPTNTSAVHIPSRDTLSNFSTLGLSERTKFVKATGWNLQKILVPEYWAANKEFGTNIIVSSIGTGVDGKNTLASSSKTQWQTNQ